MIGGLSPTYHCDTLGAPFRVELVNSVIIGQESVTIPNFGELIATVGIERLRDVRRISGKDLVFLRKCAQIDSAILVSAIGVTADELHEYETDARPMNATIEKLVRIYLHDRIRKMADIVETEDALNYVEWVMDWRPVPMSVDENVMRLAHQAARGWHLVI